MFSLSPLDNSFTSSDEGVDGHGLEAAWPASFSLTGDAPTTRQLPAEANLKAGALNHDIYSAPVALGKRSLRNRMTLPLREAMESDVVLQVEALEQARAEGRSIFGGRVGSRSAAAQTTGHAGLDIGHKFQPLSSDRALGGKPSGASRPLELAQEL